MTTKNMGVVTAYGIAKKNGFTGTEAEWLASLKGGATYTAGDYITIENDVLSVDPERGVSVVTEYTGDDFEFSAYVTTGGQGSALPTIAPNSDWSHVFVDAEVGDVFVIEGIGGNSPRLWNRLTTDHKIIETSEANINTIGNPVTITITEKCVMLIQSNLKTEPTSNFTVSHRKGRLLTSDDLKDISESKPLVIGNPTVYISETLPYESLNSTNTDDIYAAMDDLVTRFPQYVRRSEDLGSSVAGVPIRSYSIRFQDPIYSEGNFSHTLPTSVWTDEMLGYNKVVITNGIHGDEKASHWGCIYFLTEMLEKLETTDWAQYIMGNLIIEIAPMTNPDGFNATRRTNNNAKDLNRDFVGFTQPETLAMKALFDRHNTAVAHLDIHNGTGFHQFGLSTALDAHYIENMKGWIKLGSALSANWKKTYDDANSKSDYPYLYLLKSYTDLNTAAYAVSLGMRSFVVEGARDFINGSSTNYKSSSKFTKDQMGNLLLAIASL